MPHSLWGFSFQVLEAVRIQNPNHWTTRRFPIKSLDSITSLQEVQKLFKPWRCNQLRSSHEKILRSKSLQWINCKKKKRDGEGEKALKMEFKKHNHCVWILLGSWFKLFLGFPCGSAGKEFTRNAGDLGSIPGVERSSGEGTGYPLQYSGLENSMDCIVQGIAKSQTQLSDSHFLLNRKNIMTCKTAGIWILTGYLMVLRNYC